MHARDPPFVSPPPPSVFACRAVISAGLTLVTTELPAPTTADRATGHPAMSAIEASGVGSFGRAGPRCLLHVRRHSCHRRSPKHDPSSVVVDLARPARCPRPIEPLSQLLRVARSSDVLDCSTMGVSGHAGGVRRPLAAVDVPVGGRLDCVCVWAWVAGGELLHLIGPLQRGRLTTSTSRSMSLRGWSSALVRCRRERYP